MLMVMLLSGVSTLHAGPARPAVVPEEEQTAGDSSGVVLLQLSQDAGIRDVDRTPRVRLYGDFRVAVHFPIYTRRAGDYELTLGEGQIWRVVDAIDTVRHFDSASTEATIREVETAARAAALRENRPIVVSDWSDEVTTILEVWSPPPVIRYQPDRAGGHPASPEVEQVVWPERLHADAGVLPTGAAALPGRGVQVHRVVWVGLRNRAERFPQIDALQRLAAVERWLVDLSNDERLVPVERTPSTR